MSETEVPPPPTPDAVAGDPVAAPPPLPQALPLPPPRLRANPIDEKDRFVTLDVIRGIALCGILLVNMENFAMVREARYDPALGGGDSAIDHFVWMITYLFADTKFIAIFTMLFGAGIAMADQRRKARGASGAWAVHLRRMFFLLAVGAMHGLYLWRGDILYFYAFWGLWLYFAPRVPALLLAIVGLGFYWIFMQDFSNQLYHGNDGYSWWEQEVFRGDWRMQYEYRMQSERYYLTQLPFDFSTHLLGLMFFGMSLFKSGFLPGRWPTWSYFAGAVLTLPLGAWLVIDGTGMVAGLTSLFNAKQFVWGSLILSLGYLCAAITLTKILGPRFGLEGFAALGRMAFTNYLMQTRICTTIFYGYGFGMFGRTSRGDQFGLVAAICAFQMLYSIAWLKVFTFGPLEWVWRSFSYWRVQPILRRIEPSAEAETTL